MNRDEGRWGKMLCTFARKYFFEFSKFFIFKQLIFGFGPLGIEGRESGFPFSPRKEWTRRKGSNFAFWIFIFIQWIARRGDCHLDSAEKLKTGILRQQSGWIEALSFSPDGRFLASANDLGIADDSDSLIVWATEVNEKTERIKSKDGYLFVIQSEWGTRLHRQRRWWTFVVVVFVYGCHWLKIDTQLIRWQGINGIFFLKMYTITIMTPSIISIFFLRLFLFLIIML
jgi:hypothetical protein